MIKLQVTFFQKENKYKPISTIVEIGNMEYYQKHQAEVQKRALMNIAHNKKCLPQDLIKDGYTKVKVGEYEKIQAQKELQHKINLIKYIERKRQEKKENN